MSTGAILVALLLAAEPSSDGGPGVDRSEALEAARQVMAAAGLCTLVTLDASGHPQARVMDPFPPEDDFTVLMGTNRSTRKVGQIEADPRVTLSCFDRESVGYVTLLGRAELIDDPATKARYFKDGWADFYADRHRGPDFLLIRLVPERLEMISIAHEIASDPRGWKPHVVEFPPGP